LPENVYSRHPWKAAFLAILPGAGQLYNRQPRKAALFFLLLTGWMVFAASTLRHPLSNWILNGYLALTLLAFHDALLTALAINRIEVYRARKIAYFFAWVFYAASLMFFFSFMGTQSLFYSAFRVPDAAMEPFLHEGELVLVRRFGVPEGGDLAGRLALYRPRPMKVRVYGKQLSHATIDQPLAVGLVMAGPGQTLERRTGQYYVDGQLLPEALAPFARHLPETFTLQAGTDEYLIPVNRADQFLRPPGIHGKAMDFWQSLGVTGILEYHWELENWDEVCRAPGERIEGVVWAVLDPPPARRFLENVSKP
jgi:signal peptidase I